MTGVLVDWTKFFYKYNLSEPGHLRTFDAAEIHTSITHELHQA